MKLQSNVSAIHQLSGRNDELCSGGDEKKKSEARARLTTRRKTIRSENEIAAAQLDANKKSFNDTGFGMEIDDDDDVPVLHKFLFNFGSGRFHPEESPSRIHLN